MAVRPSRSMILVLSPAQAGDFRFAAACHYPPIRNGYCIDDRAFRVKRMQPPIQDEGVCVA